MRCILIFLVFTWVTCTGQTSVPAGLVYGTWTQAGSPYNILGDIQVPNDSTLSLQPGVSVVFQGSYKLDVKGRVVAIGTPADSITFMPQDTSIGWLGIDFDNTLASNDSSLFAYCILKWGKSNGTATPDANGGAFYFDSFSKVKISNSNISLNSADVRGGAIYIFFADPLITHCLIKNNRAGSEGGAIYSDMSDVQILNNDISYNTSGGGGGAMSVGGSFNIRIMYNTISHNKATSPGHGGGIWTDWGQIVGNLISFNTSGADGGGIGSKMGGPFIDSNIIINNVAAIRGGGIYSYGSSPTITNNQISDNSAVKGGGIMFYNGSDGYVHHNMISNNTAGVGGGGAIACDMNNSNPIVHNNSIVNNTSPSGGAIVCRASDPVFTNNTIANNGATNGGAVYCDGSLPTFSNCILYGNMASGSGNQVFLFDQVSQPGFTYCDIEGNLGAFGLNGNTFTGTYANNINANPQYVSPSAGAGTGFNGAAANWTLLNNSPCINSGDPSGTYPATDVAGNPRVVGGVIDMGAYEFQGNISIPATMLTGLDIFPNPTSGSITIKSAATPPMAVSIHNVEGRIVKQETFLSNTSAFDLSALPAGVYALQIVAKDQIVTQRVSIIKN